MKKITEYLEYRKNKRTAKRALVRLAACVLPAIGDTAVKGADIIKFVIRLTSAAKDMNGERLVEMVLSEVSDALQSDNEHIIEILTYMAALNPEDIRKILIHSAVEAMPDIAGGGIRKLKDGDDNG